VDSTQNNKAHTHNKMSVRALFFHLKGTLVPNLLVYIGVIGHILV